MEGSVLSPVSLESFAYDTIPVALESAFGESRRARVLPANRFYRTGCFLQITIISVRSYAENSGSDVDFYLQR